MSAIADIRQFVADKAGWEFTTAAIAEHCEASISAVYNALSMLADSGELIRLAVGKYQVPSANSAAQAEEHGAQAAVATTPTAVDQKPASKPAARPTRPAARAADLEVAVYLSGSVEIRHGSARMLLEEHDVRRLMEFLRRCEVAA